VEVSAPKPKIVSPEEVLWFLQQFRKAKEQNGLVFLDRQKNFQALLDLEISAQEREEVIDRLAVQNYYKGPRPDGVRMGGEFWEFGAKVGKGEVYIKLSLGIEEGPVLCFSFHPAERKIRFPYR
jgi:hypothetical protein